VLTRFLRQISGTGIPANLAFWHRLGGPDGEPAAGEMEPVTYAHTRHLLATCAQGSCAGGLTAVLPCQCSYGELAGPLMAALPADPVHADWMFGNDDYATPRPAMKCSSGRWPWARLPEPAARAGRNREPACALPVSSRT